MNKKIVLIMIIVLLSIVLVGGGIFAYTYFFTDVFLTEEQAFYKYIAQNSQMLEMFEDEEIDKYFEKSKNEAYSNNGEISISLAGDIDEETKKITDEIPKHKITFNGNVDKANNYSYQELKLIYGENDVISGAFVQQNDYLGLKVNDIGLNPYIVLENNNLKQFAKNLGLSDEEIASIPDKIDLENLQNQEIFTKEELVGIKDRYLKAITDNLTEDMFTKTNQDGMDVYTLTVTEEKAKVIVVALIDTLKNDDVVLNKFKQLYIEQQSVTEEEAQTMIDSFKEALDEAKNELNETSSYDNYTYEEYNEVTPQENTESKNLYINVYVSKRNLVKTEFFIEDEGKLIIENSKNKASLEVAVLKDNTYKTTGSISIEKNKTESEISYKFTIMGENNKEIAKVNLTYTGLAEMTNVGTNLLVDIYCTNSSNDILSEMQDVENDNVNATEEESVKLAMSILISEIYADTYTSENEVVMNETTIKEALSKQELDATVSINEDGTYRVQSNTTGNIYTVDAQGNLTNTEFIESTETTTTVEDKEETINISLNLKNTITFGEIQQQELTDSNMYIINNKTYEQLESLFTKLGERIGNKITSVYQNTVVGQMISQ